MKSNARSRWLVSQSHHRKKHVCTVKSEFKKRVEWTTGELSPAAGSQLRMRQTVDATSGSGEGQPAFRGGAGSHFPATGAPRNDISSQALFLSWSRETGRGNSGKSAHLSCAAVFDSGRVREVDSRIRGNDDLQGVPPRYLQSRVGACHGVPLQSPPGVIFRRAGIQSSCPNRSFFAFFT